MKTQLLHVVLMSLLALLPGCKARRTGSSSIAGIDSGVSNLLDISKSGIVEEICSRNDIVVFIANGEKLGILELNQGSNFPFTERYLKALQKKDAAKDQWYFGRLKEEYVALQQRLAVEDPACIGIKSEAYMRRQPPALTLVGILDGPEVGDSIVEISRYGRPSLDEPWRTLTPPTRLAFDPESKSLKVATAGEKLEILMPRDIAPILTSFRNSKSLRRDLLKETVGYPYEMHDFYKFGLEIVKGHGFKTAYEWGSGGVPLETLLKAPSKGDRSALLFDAQDAKGQMPRSESRYVWQLWSPEAICSQLYLDPEMTGSPAYDRCLDSQYKKVETPFDPSTIDGCAADHLARLMERQGDEAQGEENQGDELQGDELQGDELQGDELQGDELQGDELQGDELQGDELQGDELQGDELQGPDDLLGGLSGASYGLNQHQGGGKGVAVYKAADFQKLTDAAGARPAALKHLGFGLPLNTWHLADIVGRTERFDLPFNVESEMVVFDSCNVNFEDNFNDWGKGRPGAGFGSHDHLYHRLLVLKNPFPMAADAIRYGSLSLQKYYYLQRLLTKADRPFPAQAAIAEKIRQQLSPDITRLKQRYCAVYETEFECIHGGTCRQVRDQSSENGEIAGLVDLKYADRLVAELIGMIENEEVVSERFLRHLGDVLKYLSAEKDINPSLWSLSYGYGYDNPPYNVFFKKELRSPAFRKHPVAKRLQLRHYKDLRSYLRFSFRLKSSLDPLDFAIAAKSMEYLEHFASVEEKEAVKGGYRNGFSDLKAMLDKHNLIAALHKQLTERGVLAISQESYALRFENKLKPLLELEREMRAIEQEYHGAADWQRKEYVPRHREAYERLLAKALETVGDQH